MAMATQQRERAIGLNTGALLKQVLKIRRITHAALARAVNRSQSNISVILGERSTQAYILWEMSIALRHNLFTDIAAQLDAATEGRLQEGKPTVEALQAELAQVREERDTLMRVVEKLSR
jgi:hypothetical protein